MDVEPGDPVSGFLDAVNEPLPTAERAISRAPAPVSTGYVPLQHEFYVTSDTYYRVEPVGGVVSDRVYEVRFDRVAADNGSADGSEVSFENLSTASRRTLHPPLLEVGNLSVGETRSLRVGVPNETVAERFTGEAGVRIRFGGRHYVLSNGSLVESSTVVRAYRAERIGSTRADIRSFLEDHFLVDLDDVGDSVRSLVREAIDGGVDRCIEDHEANRRLQRALPDERRLPWTAGRWWVTFEGKRYVLTYRPWSREP